MKDQYGKIARWYDGIFEPLNSGLRKIGLKKYAVTAGSKVLDIGCGTGAHLKLYQDLGCKVYGVDMSSAMLEVARKKLGSSATLSHGSATDLHFSERQFHLILCTTVLHEMDANVRLAVLKEAMRVLHDTGRILLIDFHPATVKNIKGLFSKLIISVSERLAGEVHYRNYRQFMRAGGLPALIKTAELTVAAQKIVSGGNFGIFLLKK